jgi:hypothetical protein
MPADEQIRRIVRSGRRVVIYRPDGKTPTMPAELPVTYLAP